MENVQECIDDYIQWGKRPNRKKNLIEITIIEIPPKGAIIQFRTLVSQKPVFVSYHYNDKLLLDHVLHTFTRHCYKDGCCTTNRKIVVFANLNDCKDINNGTIKTMNKKSIFFQHHRFSDVTIIELKHSAQLYFNNKKISIHGRKFLDECKIFHSPVNDEFSCYPRIVSFNEWKSKTASISPINHA